ncbi:hypothetical protein [Phytohabitans rumicis]
MSLQSPLEVEPVTEPAPPSPFDKVADVALRVAGGIIAVIAALATGVLELMLAQVRVGGYLIGVSVVAAVVLNMLLGWFAYATVGRKWAIALPAACWIVLMMVASGRTTEGDLLLVGPQGNAVVDANSWVGLTMIFAGSIAFAVIGFRLMLASTRRV